MNSEENFAEYLSEQARSPTSAIHEFRIQFEENSVHTFFEGEEDVLYYLPELRPRLRSRRLNSYLCGGKWGVLEVRDFIRSQGYTDALCLYFVDRDYDDLFGCQADVDSCTYLTDDYSIENAMVSVEAIEVVLTDFMSLSRVDVRYRSILALFEKSHNCFVKKIEPLLAWSIALRGVGGKVNYNNVNLKKIFCVQADGVVGRAAAGFSTFQKDGISKAGPVRPQDVKKCLRLLRQLPVKQRIRGKYELWFFETFLTVAIEAAHQSKKKVPTAVLNHLLFEALSPRLEKPASLKSFLDHALQ